MAADTNLKGSIFLEDLRFIDEDGNEISSTDWRGNHVLLVFLRWLG